MVTLNKLSPNELYSCTCLLSSLVESIVVGQVNDSGRSADLDTKSKDTVPKMLLADESMNLACGWWIDAAVACFQHVLSGVQRDFSCFRITRFPPHSCCRTAQVSAAWMAARRRSGWAPRLPRGVHRTSGQQVQWRTGWPGTVARHGPYFCL